MKFKTNASCEDCVAAIRERVNREFPNAKLSLDLQSADKVLEVHGIPEDSEHAAKIIRNIEEAGFKGAWLERGVNNL